MGVGTLCPPHMETIPRDSIADALNKLKFHEFVSFNILSVPLKIFFIKHFEDFEKLKKRKFYHCNTKGEKNQKNFKN